MNYGVSYTTLTGFSGDSFSTDSSFFKSSTLFIYSSAGATFYSSTISALDRLEPELFESGISEPDCSRSSSSSLFCSEICSSVSFRIACMTSISASSYKDEAFLLILVGLSQSLDG